MASKEHTFTKPWRFIAFDILLFLVCMYLYFKRNFIFVVNVKETIVCRGLVVPVLNYVS